MAQHDYVIDNQTGASFREDLNNALDAVKTNNSGSSAPSTNVAGQLWLDTSATNNLLKVRDQSTTSTWHTLMDIQSGTLVSDTVKPSTTNGSLSLKGDSGGSATTNGISIDSSGDTSITGTTTTSTASLDGAVTINESGADVDFRVESDTVDYALFVQGSDGHVGIGVSSPADKLHVDGNIRLTSGSGINFSAYATTGNPSSNLLDDYEEGTFAVSWGNPPIVASGTATYSGYYTKIGRLVYVTVLITLSSGASITTNASSTYFYLPFASNPGSGGGGNLQRISNANSDGNTVVNTSGSGTCWLPTQSSTTQNLSIYCVYTTT